MASFERCAIDENGNLVKITIGGDTELSLTGSCVLATSATAPPGTLIADGSEVSRQAYDKLFAKIGTAYGAGDGVTTFALPDWRDEFPRFSGADRAVGTKQGDAIRNIECELRKNRGALPLLEALMEELTQEGALFIDSFVSIHNGSSSGTTYSLAYNLKFDASRSVPTADENRPRNVAFLPCIVYL